jgi:hypothetical protein
MTKDEEYELLYKAFKEAVSWVNCGEGVYPTYYINYYSNGIDEKLYKLIKKVEDELKQEEENLRVLRND